MAKVLVSARMENIHDLHDVERGMLDPTQVRVVEVPHALVDTGATTLMVPKRLLNQLGLKPYRTRYGRTVAGTDVFSVYGPVRLTIEGRDCHVDAVELPDEFPVFIGRAPLDLLDWVA